MLAVNDLPEVAGGLVTIHADLETVDDGALNRVQRPGEESPFVRIGPMGSRVFVQPLWRVPFGIDRE